MITADNNWRTDGTTSYQFIKCKPCFFTFTLAQPTYPCRQTLECDPAFSKPQPTLQSFILWKHVCNEFIGDQYIIGIATQCRPAKRALSFAKQWTNVCRYKTRKGEA